MIYIFIFLGVIASISFLLFFVKVSELVYENTNNTELSFLIAFGLPLAIVATFITFMSLHI